ncbi:MAG: Monogalactosyldiacylglycerol synthase [Desulfotomaculum sp. 46_296]|nr:MAG: Monogalactosyldiacylglycerol synthase [Desulfotomaculum sp. 46_296]HAU31798.1 galactosyldiacylglycerol synthase [Desulfotomaculum sp.]
MLKRVLILSVSIGEGHMQAAMAIKEAILKRDPYTEVNILDTFRSTNPIWDKMVSNTYMEILRITPAFYGYLYRLAEKESILHGTAREEFNRVLNVVTAPRLNQLLNVYSPQVIICTHPFPVGVLNGLKERGEYTGLLVGILTDFTVHPFWVFPKVDLYSVAAEEIRMTFKDYNFNIDSVHACGIPINSCFLDSVNKSEVKSKLSLQQKLKTILVMGGGLGMGPISDIVKVLGDGSIPCQVIVVTGYNETLRAKLERMVPDFSNPVRVLGFADNVHELMSAADLMIGKAGGLTCAEALAKGLPIFIVDPIPGQEVRNTEFLCKAGAAVQASNIKDLANKVEEYLNEPRRLQKMSVSALHMGKPLAAQSVIRTIESYVDSVNLEAAGI